MRPLALALLAAVATLLLAVPLWSQPTRAVSPKPTATAAALDSAAAVCLNVTWLDENAVCGGRVANTVSSMLVGGTTGALAGFTGGLLAPTSCFGNPETATVRGAAAGAAVGLVAGVLQRQVSRRQLAARLVAEREAAQQQRVRPWSWRDVRPVFVVAGATALGGAALGAVRGRASDACPDGVGANALRGAGVYGGGAVATVAGALFVVRWLF